MSAPNPVIKFTNINKAYGDKLVLKQLNFSVNKGQFITIIGSSGSGKTTTLKMINGLIKPDSGDVFVFGKNIKYENMTELRRKIGYAIQGNSLFPHMTVEENIAYVPNLSHTQTRRSIKENVKKWLRIVGLEESMKSQYPDELSGGQQQRVGIARALAASPEILLMDEPFSAVDEITREQLQTELLKIYRDTRITILFVTHDISEALKLATKVLVMSAGSIHQYASPQEVMNNPSTDFVKQLVSEHLRFKKC